MYFYNVVNQYKIHCEETNGGLIESAFESMKSTDEDRIEIATLKDTLMEDFGINVSVIE